MPENLCKGCKIKKLIVVLFLTCLTSANVFAQDYGKDQILYQKQEHRVFPTEKIDVINNEDLSVVIQTCENKLALCIVINGKEKYKIWRYYDYSGVDKISLSEDGTIIRLFSWSRLIAGLFPRKDYVTEFNIITKDKKRYRLKKN